MLRTVCLLLNQTRVLEAYLLKLFVRFLEVFDLHLKQRAPLFYFPARILQLCYAIKIFPRSVVTWG